MVFLSLHLNAGQGYEGMHNTIQAFAIVGTTRENLVLDPLAALHLDNRLHYYVDMNVGHSV